MPQLSGRDVALAFAVEGLEGLHKVGERTNVRFGAGRLVDGKDLLELVLLLAWNRSHATIMYMRFRNK